MVTNSEFARISVIFMVTYRLVSIVGQVVKGTVSANMNLNHILMRSSEFLSVNSIIHVLLFTCHSVLSILNIRFV